MVANHPLISLRGVRDPLKMRHLSGDLDTNKKFKKLKKLSFPSPLACTFKLPPNILSPLNFQFSRVLTCSSKEEHQQSTPSFSLSSTSLPPLPPPTATADCNCWSRAPFASAVASRAHQRLRSSVGSSLSHARLR